VGLFARLDMRRLTVYGLLALMCGLLFVGLTNMAWCMPALHAALTLATALGTWWLARDDFALDGSGAVGRLVLTGVSLGLGLTWAGAIVAALLGVAEGAQWTQGEFAQVRRGPIRDDIAMRDYIASLHQRPLIDAGILIRSHIFYQAISIYRFFASLSFVIRLHNDMGCINGLDDTRLAR